MMNLKIWQGHDEHRSPDPIDLSGSAREWQEVKLCSAVELDAIVANL